jgi:hypothetical protein
MTRTGARCFMVKTPHIRKGAKVADYMLAVTRGGWGSRAGARRAYAKSMSPAMTWRQCYARGCRVVMVDIKEMR